MKNFYLQSSLVLVKLTSLSAKVPSCDKDSVDWAAKTGQIFAGIELRNL